MNRVYARFFALLGALREGFPLNMEGHDPHSRPGCDYVRKFARIGHIGLIHRCAAPAAGDVRYIQGDLVAVCLGEGIGPGAGIIVAVAGIDQVHVILGDERFERPHGDVISVFACGILRLVVH